MVRLKQSRMTLRPTHGNHLEPKIYPKKPSPDDGAENELLRTC